VLRDIDLTIQRNWTVAFVGDSGSGKSTMVDLVTGTLHPSAGRILVDGLSMADLDLETLRRRIGYVPQDSMLFDDSVANNLALWNEATDDQLRDAARRARALEFIEAMSDGFATQVGERGIKLSGGQRQRLAIARELMKEPDILVLDEATSALDSESESAIQESINALKGRMTILIIAHRLSTIRNCDRIFVLHDQKVVEMGSYQELLSRPGSRFARMCELQRLAPEERQLSE
jgi:ABC-type multidrug transport system fused ATPase/permease subunit